MTHQFTVSDLGLRLIKAYEGYRSESRTLVSGQNVVGYGHRIADQDAIALTREEAETLLREDILPVEDLINEVTFAPLTQGQFDALCSLAYNIGPDAFLKSDVLRALNNGRPIEAANGFDVWRKGQVGGRSYIIDALVRRRTAEKALFLKPDRRPVTSPRHSLPPQRASRAPSTISKSDEVFNEDDASAYVEAVPYDLQSVTGRRREDGPAGILELSEYVDEQAEDTNVDLGFVPESEVNIDEIDVDSEIESESPDLVETDLNDEPLESSNENVSEDSSESSRAALEAEAPMTLSPIAEAAADVSSRLDALIDDFSDETTDVSDVPDALIDGPDAPTSAVVVPFKESENIQDDIHDNFDEAEPPKNVTSLTVDEPSQLDRPQTGESTARFIQGNAAVHKSDDSVFAYGIMLLSGVVMLALSFYTWLNDPIAILGTIGPIAALGGVIMGGVIILGSVWYIFKSGLKNKPS